MVGALTALARGVAATFQRITRDRSGVSAVEFALILPIMLTIYLGGNEFGHALTINRKVTHVTSTIADLVGQSKTITDADMTNIFNAAASIVTPYPTTNLKLRVSVIKIDATGKATVEWSDARNDTARAKNDVVTTLLPAGVKQNNTYLVMAEVVYPYTPMIGYVLTGTKNLSEVVYLRPRLSASVTRKAS
jgi:Flp pilus assembly protein TadG